MVSDQGIASRCRGVLKRTVLIMLGSAAITSVSHAQGIAPGGGVSGTIDRENRAPELPRSRPSEFYKLEKPGASVSESAASTSFMVSDIMVDGVTVIDPASIRQAVTPFTGRAMTLAELGGAADAISRLYAREGYALSFALIPEQVIRDGIVRIKVIEGQIDQVVVHVSGAGGITGKARLEAAIRPYFLRLKNDGPVRSRDLERAALQVDDLAGFRPRIVVKPSNSVEGAANLFVEVEFAAVGGGVSIDNRLRFEFGRKAASLDLALRSSLMVGDEFALIGRVGLDVDAFRYGAIRYQLPVGRSGLTAYAEISRATTEAQHGLLGVLDFEGTERTYSGGFRYSLMRSRARNVSLQIDFEAVDTVSQALGVTLIRDKVRTVAVSASYDWAEPGGALNIVRAGVTQGISGLGATRAGNPLASRVAGKPDITALTFRVYRDQPLGHGFRLTLDVDGQIMASSSALSSVECAFGGERFGRGYDSGAIGGDHCVRAAAELSYPVRLSGLILQPLLFADGAAVRQRGALSLGEKREEEAGSVGGGVRVYAAGAVRGEVLVTKPLKGRYAEKAGNARVYASLGMRF